jgi:hypothetical protein
VHNLISGKNLEIDAIDPVPIVRSEDQSQIHLSLVHTIIPCLDILVPPSLSGSQDSRVFPIIEKRCREWAMTILRFGDRSQR